MVDGFFFAAGVALFDFGVALCEIAEALFAFVGALFAVPALACDFCSRLLSLLFAEGAADLCAEFD